MERLSPEDLVRLFLALGTILAAARLFGEAARRLRQPPVLGEIAAGILLGPTVLGAIVPETMAFLVPRTGAAALALDGFRMLAITLFLLVAGLEVDLSTVWRHGRPALLIGTMGIVAPFALGLGTAGVLDLFAVERARHPAVFPLFFATALAISALPVIARTLMDLGLYRTRFGMTVMAAAVFDDVIGWTIFAVLLAQVGTAPEHASGMVATVAAPFLFVAGMLLVGRPAIDRLLPRVHAAAGGPAGVLGFAAALALFGAAFTEWLGMHAIFGAFMVGVALGDSAHLDERTRTSAGDFVSSTVAPIFFGSIGLGVDFARHFDPGLTAVVLLVACAAKILGCGLGARLAGLAPRESWALGAAMNARGSMEIIVGQIALQNGLIGERMFVALVVMALVTSLMSGPAIRRLLQRTASNGPARDILP